MVKCTKHQGLLNMTEILFSPPAVRVKRDNFSKDTGMWGFLGRDFYASDIGFGRVEVDSNGPTLSKNIPDFGVFFESAKHTFWRTKKIESEISQGEAVDKIALDGLEFLTKLIREVEQEIPGYKAYYGKSSLD
jgi:hypothetical protein